MSRIPEYQHVETADGQRYADYLASPGGKAEVRLIKLMRALEEAQQTIARLETEQPRAYGQAISAWGKTFEEAPADVIPRIDKRIAEVLDEMVRATMRLQERHDLIVTESL